MVQNDTVELRETTLSPEVRRIRNSIIKKFAHEPLDIMAKFVKDVVENEQDTVKRLGAMAARVEILRMRISQISKTNNELNFDSITEEDVEEHESEESSTEIVITSPNLSDWVRLRIIENSEINGVRFPKGVVIDVSQEDGDRLLESGKASYVDEDEISDVKSDLNLQKKSEEKLTKMTEENFVDAKEEGKASAATGDDISELAELPADAEESAIQEEITDVDDSNDTTTDVDDSNDTTTDVDDSNDTTTKSAIVKKRKKNKKIEDDVGSSEDSEVSSDSGTLDDESSNSAEDMLAGFDLDANDTKS